MLKEKYLHDISEKIKKIAQDKNLKFFLYGSCLNKDRFGDLDLGVIGEIKKEDIRQLKENFENSTLPYFVDVVNFNNVSSKFKDNVFKNKILWLTPSH